MTKEEVIKLAREAGFEELFKGSGDWICTTEEIERCAALVAAAEREGCAKVCERDDSMRWSGAANAIRNRREA